MFIEPVNMTQGDCSAQVLKYKQAGVEYWDWQSFAFVFCMPAEERLGWRPPLGQGGPVATMGSLSSTIGKSMEGVMAGRPVRPARRAAPVQRPRPRPTSSSSRP